MMNKQKTSKAWRWKVATFLPLLALLLMAFGETGEKVNLEKELSPQIVSISVQDSLKKVNKAEQAPPPPPPALFIEIRKDGNYLDNKLCSVEEIGKKAEMLQKKYPDVMARLKVESDVPMSRVTEVKEVLRNSKVLNINYSTAKADVSKPSTLPPPPPPIVKDEGFRITIVKDALRVNRKACTFDEIEKMLNDINPQKQFIQIDTHSTSSKELQSSLKEMLEKKDISYQILWSK